MTQNLAKNLKNLLKKHKLTTSFLARKTGISQPVIHRIMSGETTNPKIASLIPIARFFKLQVEQLLSESPLHPYPDLSILPVLKENNIANFLAGHYDTEKTIVVDVSLSPSAFCIIQEDAAMTPNFPLKSALVFDPELSGTRYPFALVKHENHILFRRVIQSQGITIISPLNKHFPTIETRETDCVVARLAQAKLCYLTHHIAEDTSYLTESLSSTQHKPIPFPLEHS